MKQDNSEAASACGRYRIFQIFYDEASRAAVDPAFIPLDNRDGRPDWFEFGAMIRYLRSADLDEDAWYGFMSPRFFEKVGITWPAVKAVLDASPDADVALFSSFWHSSAFSLNAWTFAEYVHPGLIDCTEEFLHHRGHKVDLTSLITDFDTSVNSNYMIGKASFWRLWLDLAQDYYDFVEAQDESSPHRKIAPYGGPLEYQMKVFVQERLVNWVLLNQPLIVTRPNYAFEFPLVLPTGKGLETRRIFQPVIRMLIDINDRSKRLARTTGSRLPLMIYGITKQLTKTLSKVT